MSDAATIIRAAVPGASEEFCDHILWGRTPFPIGSVTPRDLFRAASRVARAHRNGIVLCDFCDNRAEGWLCLNCSTALATARQGGA